MILPPRPKNEKERLKSLRNLDILDTPLEERFERITRIVCNSLRVPISAISLVDDSRQWFKSVQGLSVSETPREMAFCAHTILSDEPMVVPDAWVDQRFVKNPLVKGDPKIRFYAGCPLILENNLRIGTLCAIDQQPREMTDDLLSILQDLTEMVRSELSSLALSRSNQELRDELRQAERAALIDPLSRLWNRAGGEKMIEREWTAAIREKTSISIAMLDIDRFKAINDNHGHDAGDEVIRKVSRTVLSCLRPHDVICRWGGEEFLILLADCKNENLTHALDRILQTIRNVPVETETGLVSVTASIGACTVSPIASDKFSDQLKIADKALYAAKNNGRNQYVIADAPCANARSVAAE